MSQSLIEKDQAPDQNGPKASQCHLPTEVIVMCEHSQGPCRYCVLEDIEVLGTYRGINSKTDM